VNDKIFGADTRFVQNGPSLDGWAPARGGRGGNADEPAIGVPAGRGGRGQ
jgi:hypothetical protein